MDIDLEKLSNFIIPIVMLVLYFILNAKVKKKESESRPERPLKKEPTPVRRAPLHVSRKIIPSQAQPPAIHLKKKNSRPSYASKLVKGRSLRQAFLMKEILNRPYE